MYKHIRLLFLFLFPFTLFGQNAIDSILVQIEKNNTTLSALRKQVEVQKLENKIGIYLKNPEFEFNYLWGRPSAIGNRTDISIKQAFDFPTVYGYKNQISDLRNQQVDLEYQKQFKALMLETRLICIELIYTNALKVVHSKRINHAQSIATSYKAKFDKGEANIIEFNKSQINFLNIKKEALLNDIEQKSLLEVLIRLNGNMPIVLNVAIFQTKEIPIDFEQWYKQVEQNNPILSWLKQEIEISRKQEKLNSANGLPKFSAGYMSEKVVGQQFQGFSAGISIPLWENKNAVKQAKLQTLALQNIEADNRLEFYNLLRMNHAKAINLQKLIRDYRTSLQIYDNSELLKKAFDKGEISLTDYILELTIYYNSIDNLLQTEREMNKAIVQLNVYE
ncbi:MAG: hypothetical protein RIS47_1096 [Bacteroidota bacterium]|jgi:outer membrane protein TolC